MFKSSSGKKLIRYIQSPACVLSEAKVKKITPFSHSSFRFCRSEEVSGPIIIFPGSHIKENKFLRLRINLYNFIKSKLRKLKIDNFLPVNILFKNYVNIKNLKGDLVIFDQRILHCGGNSFFKNKPKYSIFLGYGARNIHTEKHEEFYSKRKGYDKKIPNNLKQLLNSKKLI